MLARQLQPCVGVAERRRESLEQETLALPGIDPRQHSDVGSGPAAAAGAPRKANPDALGITAVTASARKYGAAESRVACCPCDHTIRPREDDVAS